MHLLLDEKTLLTIVAALGYGLATILMKILSERVDVLLPAVLATILIATVFAEITLLRKVELGLAYIAIIATETLLILGFALYVGEGLTISEWLGAGFVIIGATLVSY